MTMRLFKEGDKVSATYKDTGVRKDGVIKDVLSAMYFILFEDGTKDFFALNDTDIRKLNG